MKFLLVSKEGDSAAVGQRLLAEGNDVRLFVKAEQYRGEPQGIIPQVASLNQALSWTPDIVLVGETGLVKEANVFRMRNYKVFGGQPIADTLEHDRFQAIKWLEENGVRVPLTLQFSTTAEAKKFLLAQERESRWVIKYDNQDIFSSYIGKHVDDIVAFMGKVPPRGKFILQRFVEGLFETSVELWFVNGKRLSPPNGTIEQKRFLTGDMGPQTGCQSSLCWKYQDNAKMVTEIFTDELLVSIAGFKLTSPMDVAVIISKKDKRPHVLELTPRIGLSAIFAVFAIMENDFGEFLYDALNGQNPDMRLTNEVGFALTVSVPPYPYDVKKQEISNQKIDLKPELLEHVWLCDAYYDKQQGFVTGGHDGLVCYITQADKDANKAIERTKEIAKGLNISRVQYRTDAGEQSQHLKTLTDLGYM